MRYLAVFASSLLLANVSSLKWGFTVQHITTAILQIDDILQTTLSLLAHMDVRAGSGVTSRILVVQLGAPVRSPAARASRLARPNAFGCCWWDERPQASR